MFKLMAVLVAGLLMTVACGDDDDAGNGPGGGGQAVGPGISVGEAIDSDLNGPLLVNGFLVVQGGDDTDPEVVRLCEALAESFPPQCGGRSLVVEGLDFRAIEGLQSEGPVSWTDDHIQVLGEVDGEVLRVSLTSQ